MDRKKALLTACERAGSQMALAKSLGLKSQGSVSRWISTNCVPAEYCPKIEALYGVPRHHLRPDIYGAQVPQVNVA